MKESFSEVGRQLKSQWNEVQLELNMQREELAEIVGFED